jgi:hypothetical protein
MSFVPRSNVMSCPQCMHFGWHGHLHQPVYDSAGKPHHPACPRMKHHKAKHTHHFHTSGFSGDPTATLKENAMLSAGVAVVAGGISAVLGAGLAAAAGIGAVVGLGSLVVKTLQTEKV